ncbi:MAG TPA: biotin carboxylase N-terminal domain-containing protein [Rhizomicrobium sp.]|jgi:3-methylcrotonyl-CoA carboxylase alpha subunit|nr:biotin carboxylase N-terminal domain-containing protein [Rhizomicrobium sp.]
MIESLLIANRGEIARRIIRTARRLGIRTIAVYSDADANSLFVREADQAVRIGPPAPKESYLDGTLILAAARETGAKAIHPGYGFLSENAEFAEAAGKAGLIWVGAPPAAIRAMGLKDRAKEIMQKASVPVTPGYLGADQSREHLAREAAKIGYPVLIKAVAGGGGKGMRRVDQPEGFDAALQSCKREASAAFGDDKVLIEKYVEAPRHLEVQIFADTHGNVVHLFERDCSMQRRHQKVIEEAPAPGMDDATRAALTAAAVKAAKAVHYVGAGTVEFVADGSQGLRADRIWFMEMNTRLQVEHPVTEMITGQDLVEWQLRVAAGEALPKKQGELTIGGWAMEARLYAENPASGFLPSTGPLDHLKFPSGIRIDTGVEEGDEVTPDYDPLLAKLIVHAPSRSEAAAKLAAACRDVEVWPVKTNAGFLARAASHPDFMRGGIDTGFIARHMASLVRPAEPPPAVIAAAAAALLPQDKTDPWEALTGFRAAGPVQTRIAVEIAEHIHVVEPHPCGAVRQVGDTDLLFLDGDVWAFSSPRPRSEGEAEASDGMVLSPMPGAVVLVDAAKGNKVRRGERLLVLQAMKMEYSLVAPFDGTVTDLTVLAGSQVKEGALLARIEKATEL